MSETAAAPMTAEEFIARHPTDRVELVRGVVVEKPMPGLRHGKICFRFATQLGIYLDAHDIGHGFSNDSFVRTDRGPDTVRGPDICFYSYERLPKGTVPTWMADCSPDLVVEVRSPTDRPGKMLTKVGEYFESGVRAVLVIHPQLAAATLFREPELPRTFHNGDTITIPDVLPGFELPLAKLFG
jgi:Uma2 family endonuclease